MTRKKVLFISFYYFLITFLDNKKKIRIYKKKNKFFFVSFFVLCLLPVPPVKKSPDTRVYLFFLRVKALLDDKLFAKLFQKVT